MNIILGLLVMTAERGLARNKQKSGGQRIEDEFTNNTMYA